MITSKDFIDWKSHPVTKQVFQNLQERADALKEILGEAAGLNPLQDRYHAGYIAAVNDILLAQFQDIGEE